MQFNSMAQLRRVERMMKERQQSAIEQDATLVAVHRNDAEEPVKLQKCSCKPECQVLTARASGKCLGH